ARDVHARLVGLAQRQHAIRERLGFVARHDFRPVLRMVTLRKRHGGHPWLTELSCDGSPFPSLNDPPSQYEDLPPIMSIAFQNTGVLLWYATSRSMPAILPFRTS